MEEGWSDAHRRNCRYCYHLNCWWRTSGRKRWFCLSFASSWTFYFFSSFSSFLFFLPSSPSSFPFLPSSWHLFLLSFGVSRHFAFSSCCRLLKLVQRVARSSRVPDSLEYFFFVIRDFNLTLLSKNQKVGGPHLKLPQLCYTWPTFPFLHKFHTWPSWSNPLSSSDIS